MAPEAAASGVPKAAPAARAPQDLRKSRLIMVSSVIQHTKIEEKIVSSHKRRKK
jgi:hypothetical protein